MLWQILLVVLEKYFCYNDCVILIEDNLTTVNINILSLFHNCNVNVLTFIYSFVIIVRLKVFCVNGLLNWRKMSKRKQFLNWRKSKYHFSYKKMWKEIRYSKWVKRRSFYNCKYMKKLKTKQNKSLKRKLSVKRLRNCTRTDVDTILLFKNQRNVCIPINGPIL